jgi:hypothetical protein
MSITMVMASEDVCLPTIGALAEDLKNAIAPDATVRLDLTAAASPDLSVSARRRRGAISRCRRLPTRRCARC